MRNAVNHSVKGLIGTLLLLAGTGHGFAQEKELPLIKIRMAAGQFRLEPDLKSNLKTIDRLLEQASRRKVELIVFPEMGLTGYPPRDCDNIDFISQPATEKALSYLKERAARLKIALAVGAGWKEKNGTWRNRAFFIDEKGDCLAHYDKIQQTSHERKFFVDGERLPVFEWRGVKTGMLICMDMRYPELWRLMRREGVLFIMHLAAAYGANTWKRPVLEGTIRCRAAENGIVIVSCNNAGPEPMMFSAIFNRKGLIEVKADYEEEKLIVADVSLEPERGFVDFKDRVYKLVKTTTE